MGVIKGGLYSTEGMWKHNSTWRDKVLHVIHHKYMHTFITILLIIDLCVVITSISLEIEHLDSEVEDLEHCVHVCYFGDEHHSKSLEFPFDLDDQQLGLEPGITPANYDHLEDQTFATSSEETKERGEREKTNRQQGLLGIGQEPDSMSMSDSESEPEAEPVEAEEPHSDEEVERSEDYLECEARARDEDDDDAWGNENLKEAEEALAYVSIAILCVFIIEHIVLFCAMGLDYLRSPILIFDFAVIAVSLALEIIFQGQPEAGLLIIARAWRFIRILHGFHETTSDEVVKETVHELTTKREDILNIYAALDDRLLVGASKKEAMENVTEQYPETIFEILQILGHHFQKDKQEHLHIKETIEHRMHPNPSHANL